MKYIYFSVVILLLFEHKDIQTYDQAQEAHFTEE